MNGKTATHKPKVVTINCPRCGQTLPGWAEACQFCGTTITRGFVRPVDMHQYRRRDLPTWREASYIVVSILIIAQGIFQLLLAFNVIQNPAYALGGGTFMGLLGSGQCILGVGMLFYQTWAQFIMKWVCVVALFGHGLSVLMAMMLLSNPHFGWPTLLERVLYLGLDIFTIFILNSEGDL